MNNCECLVHSGVCVCVMTAEYVCVLTVECMWNGVKGGIGFSLQSVSGIAQISLLKFSPSVSSNSIGGRWIVESISFKSWKSERIFVAPWKASMSARKSRWWKMLVTVKELGSPSTQETTLFSLFLFNTKYEKEPMWFYWFSQKELKLSRQIRVGDESTSRSPDAKFDEPLTRLGVSGHKIDEFWKFPTTFHPSLN